MLPELTFKLTLSRETDSKNIQKHWPYSYKSWKNCEICVWETGAGTPLEKYKIIKLCANFVSGKIRGPTQSSKSDMCKGLPTNHGNRLGRWVSYTLN